MYFSDAENDVKSVKIADLGNACWVVSAYVVNVPLNDYDSRC